MPQLNFELHPAQMTIFENDARFKIIAAGRRFGKSYLSAVLLGIEALKTENGFGYNTKDKEVWYIAPTFQQGKDIMWGLLKNLLQEVIESTVENTGTIRLVNGRKIQIKGSDRPDTLRGVGISFVVLDEYASMKPSVWEEIIRPTLADVKGSAMFIGTPEGKNHFYDLYCDAEGFDGWMNWTYNSTDNPFLDPEEIETARITMSSANFRKEFEASFETAGGGIFREEFIQYSSVEPAEGMWFIAVDPAGYEDVRNMAQGKLKRLDETAIAVVKVNEKGWWVKTVDAGRWDIRETSLRILRHAQSVHATTVGIEQGALRNAILPYMEDQMKRLGVFPHLTSLTHGGRKKTERITWALQGRFEHGRITFNPGVWAKKFLTQMMDFPNPMSHDDLLDALAYIDQIAIANYNTNIEVEDFEPLDDLAGY